MRIVMKLFSSPKIWMPLVGLGVTLAVAPQSRAQADTAPDQFEVAYNVGPVATATVPAPKAKPAAAASAQAAKNKPGTHATLQVTSAKNLPESEQSEALAIQDKRKTPTRKPNNE
jgi:hypothetical protein